MLNYTGHPLYDVGVATITAFANKDHPQDLTEADLDTIVEYLIDQYTRQPLKSFATVPFGGWAYFTQPAYTGKPIEKSGTRKILTAFKADTPKSTEQCVFTGKPAVAIQLDEKGLTPIGRATRSNIPLLTGATVINFNPYGAAGIPVSGEALLAIHALPLGCAKAGGKLLAVHSDNPALMQHFAAAFLIQNRKLIQVAQAEGSKKLPEPDYAYRTLLIDTLLPALRQQGEARRDKEHFSMTAYHFSNSGQGVDLKMYPLPMEMVLFLYDMERDPLRAAWHPLVNRAWEVEPAKKKASDAPFKPHRNWLYEDLFTLPQGAARFIRTYFLRQALRTAKSVPTDPRDTYATHTEAHLVSWDITAIFLRRIMHMEKERIALMQKLGDTLAEYVHSQNDRRFFREFFTVQRYDHFRNNLIKANVSHARRGQTPIIGFETYVGIFEEGDELARIDWRLARDLVLIRMVERLYQLGWLGQNAEVLADVAEADTSADD